MFLLAERSCGVVVILIPYLARENPPSCLHPAGSSRIHPCKKQDPWLSTYPIQSTELPKAGEEEFKLQTPILQRGDGI